MNLIYGEPLDTAGAARKMGALPGQIAQTLQKPPPAPELVINACDTLTRALPDEWVLPVLRGLGMSDAQALARLAELRLIFSREYLAARLAIELGPDFPKVTTRQPCGAKNKVSEQILPLGVLLHIAAGNMDGLPVYSVIEGLLCGNINLLKLPAADGGLSVMLLQQLFRIEPALAEYIHVFELSSQELDSILQLVELADAVVVWGGDEAVRSVRQMAPSNVRIIEWGHKLSFAYVTPRGMTKPKLEGLAHHICDTNQLLCSSCQGIFVDSDNPADAVTFCENFLPVLDAVAARYPEVPLSARAQNTLQLYSRKLERSFGGRVRVFDGERTGIALEEDDTLTASLQFRRPWVRLLPRNRIVSRLHPYKNHLQTAGLLCATDEWTPLRDLLWRAGVVRISDGAGMSSSACGDAHDGDYPLRRYTRIVTAQKK